MRELVVRQSCDKCHAEQRVGVESTVERVVTVALHEGAGLVRSTTRKRLDLCASCDAALLAKLRELLSEHGRDPAAVLAPSAAHAAESSSAAPAVLFAVSTPARPAAKEPGRGPWDCPICETTFRKHSALGHVLSKHVEGGELPALTKCPECGRKFARDASPNAIGTHRWKSHGVTRLDDALRAAGVTS